MPRLRILLTGASGLVGGAVARRAAAAGHHVSGIVGRFCSGVDGVHHQLTWDLEDPTRLEALLEATTPEVIINAAAVSEPGDCQADPSRARRLNVDLPAELARRAARQGVRLLHLSTEQVFDGERAPYAAHDPVSPLHLYGQLKVESERAVQQHAPQHALTVRAPLLMGNSPRGSRSLHERVLADWMHGRRVALFTDEIRQVAHADNLAAALVEWAARRDVVGLAHWAGRDALSRYEMGLRLRRHFRLPAAAAPIIAVSRAERPDLSATRPADLRLHLVPGSAALQTQPETFDEQLAQLIVPPSCRAWLRAVVNGSRSASSEGELS